MSCDVNFLLFLFMAPVFYDIGLARLIFMAELQPQTWFLGEVGKGGPEYPYYCLIHFYIVPILGLYGGDYV